MESKKKKVSTYLRTGTNAQGLIFNIELELKELLKEMEEQWKVVDSAFDYGMSGRDLKRPGLQHVLALCDKMEIDMLVTLKPAMLSRNTLTYMKILKKLKQNGIELYMHHISNKNPTKYFKNV